MKKAGVIILTVLLILGLSFVVLANNNNEDEFYRYSALQFYGGYVNENFSFSGIGYYSETDNFGLRLNYERYSSFILVETEHNEQSIQYAIDSINSLNLDCMYVFGNNLHFFGGIGIGLSWHDEPEGLPTAGFFSGRGFYGVGVRRGSFSINIERNHLLPLTSDNYKNLNPELKITLSLGNSLTKSQHERHIARREKAREKRREAREREEKEKRDPIKISAPVGLRIYDVNTSESNYINVSGKLENHAGKEFSLVHINVYVYDEDEIRIAEGYTNISNVSHEENVEWSLRILEDPPSWKDYYYNIEVSYW